MGWVLAGVVVAGVALGVVWRKRTVVITVQTEPVQRRDLTELVVANGRIQPVLQVVIAPEVSGEIVDLPVVEGQQVRQGDVLVQIKRDNYVASVNSASASHQSALAGQTLADANRRKAKVELDRFQQLYDNRLVSESDYLAAQTAFEVAEASYQSSVHQAEQAKAALARTQDDLAKTTIAAPMNGTVTRLRSQKGERVVGTALMAGTEIMTLANLHDMEARVDIGEIDIVLVAIGQHARLDVDAFRNRRFTGTVTEIANAAKGAANTSSQEATKFEVKIRISEKAEFRPGMSVTAEIETRHRTHVLTVPIQSVTTRLPRQGAAPAGGNPNPGPGSSTNRAAPAKDAPPKPVEVVFVAEGDRVRMVEVKRGISDDHYVEIIQGPAQDQEVVSGGYKAINRQLEHGTLIRRGAPEKEPDPASKP